MPAPDSISAEISYVKGDLERVVFSSATRALDNQTTELRRVQVRNGRAVQEPVSLHREGFEIADAPSHVVRERRDELIAANLTPNESRPQVNQDYWDELVPLLTRVSGAREVFPQHGTTVRFSARSPQRNWTTPAKYAHIDYEADEVARLMQETLDVTGRQVRPHRRHMLLQAWRVLTDPPQDVPLAVCDGRTVAPQDIIPVEFHVIAGDRDSIYRSRAGHYDDRHQWYYFPDMTIDEVLLFKGFDSACPDAMNAMHVAFEDTTAKDPVPRGSVESRFFALFD
jgi:hypothetical protein